MSKYLATYESFQVPKEWYYRGEGNCNLVISLPKTRQILRIRKTEKPRSIFRWILVLITNFFQWYYGVEFREEIRDLNFYSKVIRPLIGNNYTSESKMVVLSKKQMQIFQEGLVKKRPGKMLFALANISILNLLTADIRLCTCLIVYAGKLKCPRMT